MVPCAIQEFTLFHKKYSLATHPSLQPCFTYDLRICLMNIVLSIFLSYGLPCWQFRANLLTEHHRHDLLRN
jgi:hypothetical protein